MLPDWVEGYVGIPFAVGGRTRAGLDCWGLLALVWAEQFGRPLPDYDGPIWRGQGAGGIAEAAERYSAQFRRVPPGDEQLGDGLLLRTQAQPIHVALVVAPGWMLHVEEASGSCVERYSITRWASRIAGFYRYV